MPTEPETPKQLPTWAFELPPVIPFEPEPTSSAFDYAAAGCTWSPWNETTWGWLCKGSQ